MKNKINLILIISAIIIFYIGISVGSTGTNFRSSLLYITTLDFNDLLFSYRFNRTINAIIVGAGLSIAGFVLQTVFNNPIVGPNILGISSIASLGIIVNIIIFNMGIFILLNEITISIFIILFSIIGVILLLISINFIKNNKISLVIIGLMISYFINSITGIFSANIKSIDLQKYIYWTLGSFDNILSFNTTLIMILTIIISVFLLIKLSKDLDKYSLGDIYASSLNLNIKALRIKIIILVGLIIGASTVIAGPIVFVGLAVPHIARFISKSSIHQTNLIYTLLLGAIITPICDLISRILIFDYYLPINSITSLFGAPIVIYIVFQMSLDSRN